MPAAATSLAIVRLQMRYERWFLPLAVPLGLGPGYSVVDIDDGTLRVAMGWAFRADIPLTSITSAAPSRRTVTGWGVHGWRGDWLVNGSSKGVVELSIDPPVRAHVLGVPVGLRTLRVSVTEPDGLIAACAPS